MKVLIWIGCIIAASIIQTALVGRGSMGVLPTLLLFGVTMSAAKALCRRWDARVASRITDAEPYGPSDPEK